MTGSENEKLFVRALRQASEERFDAAMRQTPEFSVSIRHRRFMRKLLVQSSAESARKTKGRVTVRRLLPSENASLSSLSGGQSRRTRRLAAALLIGLLIALGTGLCVAATLTKREDCFNMIQRIAVGEVYDDGILSIYRCRVDDTFYNVEDWLQVEEAATVYPSDNPSNVSLKKIMLFECGGDDRVYFVYSDFRYSFCILNNNDLKYEKYTPFVYNGIQYILWSTPERDAYQASWSYDGLFYQMVAPTLEELYCMIESLVYPFDGKAA